MDEIRQDVVLNNNDVAVEKTVNVTEKQLVEKKPAKKRTLVRLFEDLALLFIVLFVTTMLFSSFAASVNEVAGVVTVDKSYSILTFILNASNNMLGAVEGMGAMGEDPTAAMQMLTTVLSSTVFMIIAITAMILAFINVILGIVFFFTKNAVGLSKAAIRIITFGFSTCILFMIFGGTSGGEGASSYYVGYKIGSGLSLAMVVGTIVFFAVSIINYIFNRQKADANGKWFYRRALVTAATYTAIMVIFATLKISGLLSNVLTGLLVSLAGAVTGASGAGILLPFLNLWLFVGSMMLFSRIKSAYAGSFTYLLSFGDDYVKPRVLKKNRANKGFIFTIVVSLIMVLSVIVLKMPSIGAGWSMDMFAQLVTIFMFASIGATLHSAFKDEFVENKAVENVDPTSKAVA